MDPLVNTTQRWSVLGKNLIVLMCCLCFLLFHKNYLCSWLHWVSRRNIIGYFSFWMADEDLKHAFLQGHLVSKLVYIWSIIALNHFFSSVRYSGSKIRKRVWFWLIWTRKRPCHKFVKKKGLDGITIPTWHHHLHLDMMIQRQFYKWQFRY